MKKKVIIIGAGYGGVRTAKKLSQCRDLEVSVIEQNSYHYLQTDVYDYIANKTKMSDIALDLFTYFASFKGKINFYQEEALRVDFKNKKVVTSKNHHKYDYLIIATGSLTSLPDKIPGLRKYYHGIKRFPNALRFKQRFEEYMFKKIETEGTCSVNSNLDIVIGGGGLSGVEIAAEMSHYASTFYKDTGYLCGGVNIVLINSSDKVLKGLDEFLRDEATARLEKLHIKVINNVRVTEVEEKKIHLNNGTSIGMDFLIWTGGVTPSKFSKALDVVKSDSGQILVDEFFRLEEHKDVFAIGDCAELFNPKTKEYIPPTAQGAELSGEYVASNIENLIKEKELQTQSIGLKGMFVALGGKYGSGVVGKGLRFKSQVGFYIKKFIELAYRYPLKFRCRKGYKLMRGED
ncbi:MAG: NAD(P)/FAD-dependent oxidoreductase [Campylobacterales bacterium]|nr:NAD(P)/FAD-dependent oxidoreductase [Campylobacterales bacterium]